MQSDELPATELADVARQLQTMYDELETIHDQVVAESERWQKKLDATEKQGFEGPEGRSQQRDLRPRRRSVEPRSKQTLDEVNEDIDNNQDKLATFLAKLDATPAARKRPELRDLVGKEFRARLSDGLGDPDPDPRLLDRASAGRPDGQPGDPDRAWATGWIFRTPWRP